MRKIAPLALAALGASVFTTPATAVDFTLFDGAGQLINNFSAGAAMRVEKQDPDIIGLSNTTSDGIQGRAYSINGDDGNLAFDKGDLVSAAAKLTSDLTLSWENFGLFVRGTYTFDAELQGKDFLDEADFADDGSKTSTTADLERRRKILQDELGNNAELLDAYIYGSAALGSRYFTLKLGRQVVNWGEATLFQNGLNSVVALDAAKVRVAGADISEVFRPSNMVWASLDVAPWLALEAFYQLEWEKTEADPSGSYFATNDFAALSGENAQTAFGRCPENTPPGVSPFCPGGTAVPRAPDIEPKDEDQGGVAARFFIEGLLGGTELSFYGANFHSRLPVVSTTATPAGFEGVSGAMNYIVEFPEDVNLYGLSFNSQLPFFGLAMSGEIAHKVGEPMQIDAVELLIASLRLPLPVQVGPFEPGEYARGYRRHDVTQFDLSFSKISGYISWLKADQMVWLLEAAASTVDDLPEEEELRYSGPGASLPGSAFIAGALGLPTQQGGYPTSSAWGYRTLLRLTYNNLFGGINVSPTFVFFHDVNGTSPGPAANFVEHRRQARFVLDFEYLQNTTVRLAYSEFFGAGAFNQIRDRDNVALSVTYSF